ncbi:MAG TPA: hypothetical protein VN364_04860, partial [Bellilinea sp.]|nr:hypothetical protein [Bellilinea sp.]
MNANPLVAFADMMSGTAIRPPVTRVLTPWLTNGLGLLFPPNIHEGAEGLLTGKGLLPDLLREYRVPDGFALEGAINLTIQFLCILGFAFALKALIGAVFKLPRMVPELLTLVGLFGLSPMMFFAYIYDLPNLFLCTLGLYCIAAGKKVAFFAVFVLAIFNKETAAVLAVPGVLLFWDLKKPVISRILAGTGTLIAVALAIRLSLAFAYRGNPGGVFEFHLPDSLEMLRDYPILGIVSILAAAGMLWLIFGGWKRKPAVAVLGAVPGLLLLVLWFIGSVSFEFREFYKVYAASFLCILATVVNWQFPLESRVLSMQQ